MSEASEASGFEANESEASETTAKTKGPRFQVEFTDDGQATGQYRAKYATIVGQVEIDLPLIRKECTLRKLNTAWKQKKYELRQVKKNSPTGEVSRTKGYVAIHTRRDGSCINFETKQSLEEIDRLVSNEPDIVERDLDNDPIALVIGRDGRGRVRGLGSGVTKTVYHASAPYKEIAQREKRVRENSESGYEAIMARLDEADKARKILEDEVAYFKRQSSGLGNASQDLSKLRLDATGIQHKLVVQHRVWRNHRLKRNDRMDNRGGEWSKQGGRKNRLSLAVLIVDQPRPAPPLLRLSLNARNS
ncbi:hypothetical protein IFM89_034617 [Coptis chinensis]|uniref:Uncharacterized protein n=1 Tax=Coptis chinensis TaxID=261450 RepID=A0A835HPU3_9MAGN|nr:hypothetical protein IFM89_034617 [Coptis chinensis]